MAAVEADAKRAATEIAERIADYYKGQGWTGIEDVFRVGSELTIAVDKAFKEAGIQIPFPQRDLHVHWPDGRAAGSAPAEQAKDVVPAKSETGEKSSPNSERTRS